MPQSLLNRLKLIGIFCHVAESKSMKEAANKLGLSAPAVSQYISQLEKELNLTLLYRSTRRLSLSETGERYYEQGRKILHAAELANEVVNQTKQSISGELRIAAPVGLAGRPIATALASVFAQHKELTLSIIAKDTFVDFVQERIDIQIDCGEPKDSNHIYHLLGKNNKIICTSPHYLKSSSCPLTPDELNQHTWLGLKRIESKGVLSDVLLNHTKHTQVHFKPSLRYSFNDLNSLISHVVDGYGIALLPELEVQHYIEEGALVKLLPDWKIDKHNIYALTPDKNYPSKTQIALDALKKYFSELK